MPKAQQKLLFVEEADVDTLVFDWGKIWWLSEPSVTGTERFTTGIVELLPGHGHGRHNHPGCEEIIYILSGRVRLMIEVDGAPVEKEVGAGALQYVAPDAYHGSVCLGDEPMRALVVYCPTGPEDTLRNDPNVTIVPAARPRK